MTDTRAEMVTDAKVRSRLEEFRRTCRSCRGTGFITVLCRDLSYVRPGYPDENTSGLAGLECSDCKAQKRAWERVIKNRGALNA